MTDNLSEHILKFADGELTPEEESCVLLECELESERWKELALALVADRQLRSALAFGTESDFSQPLISTGDQTDTGFVRRKRLRQTAVSIGGMCVAMMLAFFVGWNQAADQAVRVEIEPSPLLVDQPLTGPAGSGWQTSDPVWPPSEQQPEFANNPWTVVSKPVITEEDQGVFSDAGLIVDEENTIYLLDDGEGGQWAIPWKAINVRYGP